MYKFWNIQIAWESVMDCPKCGKQANCKDGRANGRQRYLCKDCNHRYTVAQRSTAGDGAVKRQALELYMEGQGFRSIGRMLGFSNVTILNWVRAFGEQLESIKNDSPVQVVEIDAMPRYVGSKKTIAGYGLLLIDMGKDSSVAYWAPGELQRGKSSGKSWSQWRAK
jgi:transposase-like protein